MNQNLLDQFNGEEIAVVGMAGRFPGAETIDDYWRNLHAGVESITTYTDDELRAAGVSEDLLANPGYVKSGKPLDSMEMFDAGFFGFGPRDAAILDPQHRHFLECSWEALEHAGYDPARFDGSIGVFGGSGHNAYLFYNLLSNPSLLESVGFFLLRHTGNDKDFLTTRVSYLLNLKGPSINVQTACSTSLVAVHMACQSLLNSECDMALAGGVTLELPHRQGYLYQEGEILSPDGHCRAFDANSEGTVFGSGVGVVTLRRLDDAVEAGDTIHAIIRGSAINNDGLGKANYLAPSVDGQAEAIADAIDIANITADTITYVETHGTGTRIGDPIEVEALTQAFRRSTDARGFCRIGSAKTNIGHLDTAAGIAGFIKTVLALKHRQLPASLKFSAPNPMINFDASPFQVNAELIDWQTDGFPRRAGVNSLGVGGTNAHVILEEAPQLAPSGPSRAWQLLPISAKSEAALNKATENLATYLSDNPEFNLADVAYTLQTGRQPFQHRRVLVCQDTADATSALKEASSQRVLNGSEQLEAPSIIFMFPGQGAQYVQMAHDLYQTEALFRETIDYCAMLLQPHLGLDLRDLLYPTTVTEETSTRLQQTAIAQPALFVIEYALAQLWMDWGIQPTAMIGHSIGEYVAACLAGVFSLEDALALVTKRGQLMQSLPSGAMLAVFAPEETTQQFLSEDLSLAAINGPALCVVSGSFEEIELLQGRLDQAEIQCRRLTTSHAFHSHMMDPILDTFAHEVSQVALHPPQIPYISNLSGTWVSEQQTTDPHYWASHIRQAVRFADGVHEILESQNDVLFLEVGPGKALNTFVKQQTGQSGIISLRHPKVQHSDVAFLLQSLGQLWLAGVEIDWDGFYEEETRYRIPLPTYPFEHKRYWIEPGKIIALGTEATPVEEEEEEPERTLEDWFYHPVWQEAALAQSPTMDPARWLVFSDSQGLGQSLTAALSEAGHQVTVVGVGEQFIQIDAQTYSLNPATSSDYETLVNSLAEEGQLPDQIVHLWTLNTRAESETQRQFYDKNQQLGFYSLLYLSQALSSADLPDSVTLNIVTNGLQAVNGEVPCYPEKGTLNGPHAVIPKEFPNLRSRLIDVTPVTDFGALVGQLQAEISSPVTEKTAIAYRGATRWIQTYESTPMVEKPAATPLRPGGTYLITGGLGGIGLAVAEYLAREAEANLVLISRSGLPERTAWETWLQAHPDNDKTSHRIRQVQALEELGAEVLVTQANVADKAELTATIKQAKTRFGSINGVLHAAGTIDDNLIPLKTAESIEPVLAPKIHGTLLLAELIQDEPLDFLLLFSSTSAIIGPAGQIDYVAANAFMDAFAHHRQGQASYPTIAINWGAWQEVGMTVNLAQELGLITVDPIEKPVAYPLLDAKTETEETDTYTAQYTLSTWLLDEHRIQDGDALIPGTGYLELARAAYEERGQAAVELRDVFFFAPFMLNGDDEKQIKIVLSKERESEFVIMSQNGAGPQEHVRGQAVPLPSGELKRLDLAEISAHCQSRTEEFSENVSPHLVFGPRWNNLCRVSYGIGEALATLELPEAYLADLNHYRLHPAMLDMATAGAQSIVPGLDTDQDFFVPFSYGVLRVFHPLPQKIYSHIRHKPGEAGQTDTILFDVTIIDEGGRVLVEIESFMMRRVNESQAIGGAKESPAAQAAVTASEVDHPILALLREGIAPDQGVEALARIIANPIHSQVVVVSQDLNHLIEQTCRTAETQRALKQNGAEQAGFGIPRPDLSTPYQAPGNETETEISAIWQEYLGFNQIGIHDDFFELGGHSLMLTQIITKVRKVTQINVPLSVLFDFSTIAEFAAEIDKRKNAGTSEPAAPSIQRLSRSAYRVKRSALQEA